MSTKMDLGTPLGTEIHRRPWIRGVVHVLLLVGSLIFVFPMLWMLSTSLKPADEILKSPPTWLPELWSWSNYPKTMEYIPFLRFASNTLTVSVLSVIGTVLSSALVAFSFVRLRWPGRDLIFGIVIATMMVPFPVLMVPMYSVFKAFGWVGTLKPLWVPAFLGNAFNIFLLRQFFLRIPKDLGDAMSLDGASEWHIFTRLYLPLSGPALAVVALFQFMFSWNDFMGPLLYLTDQDTFTLSLGLQQYSNQLGGTQWHLLMAASVLTVLPVVVLFFMTQKTFLKGVTFLKGTE